MPGDSVEVADWLAKSAEDRLAAGLLFPHGLHDLVGYLCQQSAEKALKGLLVSLAVQPPYTHDLQQL